MADEDTAPATVISGDKEKNAESTSPTQTGVNGSGTKTHNRPRGHRNRKSKKNHESLFFVSLWKWLAKWSLYWTV